MYHNKIVFYVKQNVNMKQMYILIDKIANLEMYK